MANYQVRLKDRREIASGTLAFYLTKPHAFSYQAGQFADLTLINPPQTDAEGDTRTFTLASAPYEDDLLVATRMRDTAFKRTLQTMALGSVVTLSEPEGLFTLHSDASVPAVFLAGGIGVTPVRSIVLQAAHDKLPHRIALFYANRRPEDAAFLDELTEVQARHPQFNFVATMTGMAESRRNWSGETGYITQAMLRKSVRDLNLPMFYLVGPPPMVSAMRQVLGDAGVRSDRIRTEAFAGY